MKNRNKLKPPGTRNVSRHPGRDDCILGILGGGEVDGIDPETPKPQEV